MAHKNRYPHAGRGEFDFGVDDFFRLHHHFPLFFGIAIFHEVINVRDHVESDLLGQIFFADRVIHVDRAGLGKQLIHRVFTTTRNGLIGRDNNAFNGRKIMQRLKRQNHLGRGAIGIGDDVSLGVTRNIIRVYFRHDQRHICVHTEVR